MSQLIHLRNINVESIVQSVFGFSWVTFTHVSYFAVCTLGVYALDSLIVFLHQNVAKLYSDCRWLYLTSSVEIQFTQKPLTKTL